MKPDLVSRLWARDYTLWKDDPTEISDRLGWLTVANENLKRIAELDEFASSTDHFEHLVLAGMGGSSLAPEVFAATFGGGGGGGRSSSSSSGGGDDEAARGRRGLHVLDTTSPASILRVGREIDPASTLFVIASKSGGTLETLSHLAHFWSLAPNGDQYVGITDPGSPLDEIAVARNFRKTFRNQPDIGGRYSALSWFGLVPAVLVGAPVRELLNGAISMADACRDADVERNPGAALGLAMGEAALAGRDKLTLVMPEEIGTFGTWIEQLIAESTGKDGKGILPVEGEGWDGATTSNTAASTSDDRFFVVIGDGVVPAGASSVRIPYEGANSLGAECFRWEFATAVAGSIIGINAFDQPNVAEAKEATNRILEAGAVADHDANGAAGSDGDGGSASDRGSDGALATLPLEDILATVRAGDYIALQAYADRTDATVEALQRSRLTLRDRYGVATTVGFGPRYLHSTGQYHKGGPNTGVFIQAVEEVGEDVAEDVAIPGKAFTFGDLIKAQAQGDLESLRAHGRRVSRVSMKDLIAIGGSS